MKVFHIQHKAYLLFDILAYLLALAVHDDISATGLRDVGICMLPLKVF